jgi:hypothetical protein
MMATIEDQKGKEGRVIPCLQELHSHLWVELE